MEKTRILVVDDEEDILKLIAYALETINYDVLTAKNQKEAMEIVTKNKPSIVLLDIRLGAESGIDVLRKIKELNSQIKVIMLTVLEDEESIRQAKSFGADDYIPKLSESNYMREEIAQKIALLAAKQRTKPEK